MSKETSASSIFLVVISFIGIGFLTYLILIFLVIYGQIHYIAFLFTLAIVIFLLLSGIILHQFKTKKRKRIFGVISLIAIALTLIQPIRHAIIESIPTVKSDIEIYDYIPFSDSSKLVQLDDEPTLKLTDYLPKIDGATALYPIYSAMVQEVYPEKEYNPYDSEVMVNTTADAYTNLFEGKVDMIFVGAPSESQLNRAKSLGLELKMTPIGREAFVFFVNKENKVNGLTIEQIKHIYSGNITNWEEVGGEDESIRAFQRSKDSGSQTALERLMGDTPIMEAPTEDVASGMGDIITEVANYRNYKNAIGYSFRFYSTAMVQNDEIKLLEIEGVAPTIENIQNETYPIVSEFYIITAGSKNPNVDKFIEWAVSDQGQEIVKKTGYVPLKN